jgi:hypothetical protein
MSTLQRTIFQLGFQISPVILTGGIASLVPGGMLPIVAITQALSFTQGLLSGSIDLNLDNYFAHFTPMAGASLINAQLGTYPFANQSVAANAIIAQPLAVSLSMHCPANAQGGYISKLLTMTAVQSALTAHNAAGGTYIVATPSKIYRNCILASLKDVSAGSLKQVQTQWQWDFIQPLVGADAAAQAMSLMMSKIDGGLPQNGVSPSTITVMKNLVGITAN